MSATIFNNFLEYWHYAKYFSEKQRKIFFDSIPKDQQEHIKTSYKNGGWDYVIKRNKINDLLDEFKKDYNFDLIDIRYKVLHNKSVFVSKNQWEIINTELKKYDSEYIDFAIGGIATIECKKNKNVVLLIREE